MLAEREYCLGVRTTIREGMELPICPGGGRQKRMPRIRAILSQRSDCRSGSTRGIHLFDTSVTGEPPGKLLGKSPVPMPLCVTLFAFLAIWTLPACVLASESAGGDEDALLAAEWANARLVGTNRSDDTATVLQDLEELLAEHSESADELSVFLSARIEHGVTQTLGGVPL